MAAKLISTGFRHTTLPENYVRPLNDRPRLTEVCELEDFPLIDLSCIDRSFLIQQIHQACVRFGFFQVINHGVSKQIIEDMVSVSNEFFSMSMEEKMKLYSDDPTKTTRLSTSFNIKTEEINNWRDYLRLHCYPIHKFVHEWPSKPTSFKEIVSNYSREVREIGFKIEELISESLGLEKNHMKKVLGEQGQHMAINYYPPCPEPELTYGLPAHTDPNVLTILLQDTTVCGLQILVNGSWFAVNPHPDAFVINIGDQLQALSNGIYKSVRHRAITNTENPRLSIATFMVPSDCAIISPAKPLWESKDDETTTKKKPMYRDYTYPEYYKKFWSMNLDQQHCLENFLND
ncbi:unnamed protein product [Cochlearia groenlandica]